MDTDLEKGHGLSPPASAGKHKEIEAAPDDSKIIDHPGNEKEEIPIPRDGTLVSIYKVPASLAGLSSKAIEPEMVFMGPCHGDKRTSSEFESYKRWYLSALLTRSNRLQTEYSEAMRRLEGNTRSCYSEDHREFISKLKGEEFVEMMMLDGCFIIELFHRMNMEDLTDENDPILSRPWLIPIVTRDLLKLENQIPFSVLQELHNISTNQRQEGYSLVLLALNLFNNSLHRPIEVLKKSQPSEDPKHLLDLFYSSLIPQNPITDPSALACKSLLHFCFRSPKQSTNPSAQSIDPSESEGKRFCFRPQKQSTVPNGPSTRKNKKKYPNDPSQKYCPSSESIQCTVQLRSSGIKFKPQRADSFLEINFQGSVISRCKELQIPPITINDFTTTLFINCMALEQCRQNSHTWFTTYIAFMSSLITSPRDVTFLCSDGIVTTGFSYNDQKVAELFKKLGEKAGFNIRECYLSKQFTDVEAYYSSCRATFIRNYFSRPWSFISVLYAVFLFVLTLGQTVFSILSYINDRS
ncbi:UPF0481 protein At3g47200-like [Pyrus x bretschneideri]|uniref:UPF0481 protein At3g47200-like n=1 Tax=Pyrus x bretschneideri TaxID=225117 RepID=UPI000510C783|nr:UPF0481 protein At3g47200-like [Pyrus x bretschneideri]